MPTGAVGLADSVKPYHRHLLACTGAREWPPHLEDDGGFLGRMARDLRERREGPPPIPKLSATDEPTRAEGTDLLVFPDRARYLAVDETSWPAVLAELSGGRPSGTPREPLPGRWVFVCVHAARDERCGRCGPPVLEAFRRACAEEGLDDVTVRATSHVGGHKYAGNVIVYPAGVWYGLVTPDDVRRLVREYLREGRVVAELHRGSMITS